MTITSSQNEKLKEVRKLNQRRRTRAQTGRFVAEGEDLLEAADAAGWTPVDRLVAAGSGLPGTEVDPAVLASIAELASGTRALAIYEERWLGRPQGPLTVYLHGLADPGNVGTILRSADAFGASCVAVGKNTADPYSPKAVRASMGSIFNVALARADPAHLPGTTVALDAAAEQTLADVLPGLADTGTGTGTGVSLLIGAERTGLPSELMKSADHTVRIPIATHSLNAAMAATVALYELTRMARS